MALEPITSADEAPVVIHGTYFEAWEAIKKTVSSVTYIYVVFLFAKM